LSVFPYRFHSTGAPLIVKIGKKTAHLHHHRVAQNALGCGASVASAAGPFIKKEKRKKKAYRSGRKKTACIIALENSLSILDTVSR
jgi:hypothetical protein